MTRKEKRANKARSSKTYEFHLVFNEVNGSIGKLVVGTTKVTTKFNSKANGKAPEVTAKAIDVDFQKSANDHQDDIRVSAVEQLLHKARKGDEIFIFTTDRRLKTIAQDSCDVASDVRSRFKEITLGRDISIQVADPSVLEDDEYIQIADRMARIHENNLKTSKSRPRGYRR